jgi:alpha-beta hydrolase superfamily lysophospholipase
LVVTNKIPGTQLQGSVAGIERRTTRGQPALNLHVDVLVLHGFPSADRFTIGRAVKRELARLFAEHGVPQSLAELGDIEHLTGGSFAVKPNRQPTAIGAQVANAVYQILTLGLR